MFTFSTGSVVARAFSGRTVGQHGYDRKLLVEAKAFISAWPPVTTPDRWPGFSWLRRVHARVG
jgi:hypothetical protein